jgi:formylglycine-generating enzyme required for sulfatase activity
MPLDSQNRSDRGEALQDAVLSYLKAIDAGRPPQPQEFLALHPELSEELAGFLADQDVLDPLLAPLRGHNRGGSGPADGGPRGAGEEATGDPDGGPSPCAGAPTDPAHGPDDLPPSVIPGYEVLGLLGRGGMGVVYRARQVRLDRVVALKVIPTPRLLSAADRARFHAEARAVARLDHPNIVRVHDSGEQDGVPYLVLEFVPGGSLADKLREGPWSPAAAVGLTLRLADAMDYAHRQGIVHRDLKPANVLLTTHGTPKIADFGLSKQLWAAAGGLTAAGQVLGTPAYMAPEQADGRPDATGPGTDVFGLGAILYDLLTGQPPFQGGTLAEVMRRAKEGLVPPPRRPDGHVPQALQRICLRAMAPDPGRRYPSAAALATDLRRYLDRPRRRVWAAGVLTGVLAAGALVCLLGLNRSARPGGEPPEGTPARPTPAGVTPPEVGHPELARRAWAIMRANCYRCHGENGSVEGGFDSVLDRRQLVARKRVVPGQPGASPLLRRVEGGEMPPEGEGPRPSLEDVTLLRRWIEAGAPDLTATPPGRQFVRTEDVFRLIRDDLERAPVNHRPFYRYFVITHLANAGLGEDSLQTYRLGLSKLINSLSWDQAITVPEPVDPGRTVFRIDLRRYNWGKEVWDAILAEYPYGVLPPTPEAGACSTLTGCPLPAVRADWFVFAASRPPLYHKVLQLPGTAGELERRLKVDVADDIAKFKAARAGFNGSGVANNNRLIERHNSPFGAYWKSYDFEGSDGPRNLFQHPLGPGPGAEAFRPDGGEIIFSLPNGLQGYMLVNARGGRIDKAPTGIVKDRRAPDAAVMNGISCMSCHVKGVFEKDDQIRAHVAQNPGAFPRAEAALVEELYRPAGELRALFRKDAERFARAVRETGSPPGTTDPVVALASRYDRDLLDANLAAAELGLTRQEFLDRLNRNPGLARVMGLGAEAGMVSRQVFADHFGELVDAFELGQRLAPGRDELRNSVGMTLRLIPAGVFRMGSPANEPRRGTDEFLHEVQITRPFFMGAHEVTQGQYRAVMGRVPAGQSADQDDLPVVNVSQKDAKEFCRRLSERLNRVYRLPTEAEWEYACRAGSSSAYPFAGGPEGLDDHGWYDANSGGRPHPVGKKLPNAWGLYDMLGNVAEWCADRYDDNYYQTSPVQDPRGPAPRPDSPDMVVLRGGSFQKDASACRCADRQRSVPGYRNSAYGFRVVLEVE